MRQLIVRQTGEVVCPDLGVAEPPAFLRTEGRVYSRQAPDVIVTVIDPVYDVVVLPDPEPEIEVTGKPTVKRAPRRRPAKKAA